MTLMHAVNSLVKFALEREVVVCDIADIAETLHPGRAGSNSLPVFPLD